MSKKLKIYFGILATIGVPLLTGAPKWGYAFTTAAAGCLTISIFMSYFQKNPSLGIFARITSIPVALTGFVLLFTTISWIDETLAQELRRTTPESLRELFITHWRILFFGMENMVMDIYDGNFGSALRVGGGSVARLIAAFCVITILVLPTRGALKAKLQS